MKDMGIPLEKRDRHFTYADYREWPDEERWEIIEGVAYNMSSDPGWIKGRDAQGRARPAPGPGTTHQRISGYLFRAIGNYLEGKPCEVFSAPFDVPLPEPGNASEEEIDSIVQPDITVVCDATKIEERGCFGAPDWVIEILSPGTSRKDQNEKFKLYEKHGVREYWIVDPHAQCIQAYRLENTGKFGEMELAERVRSASGKNKSPGTVILHARIFPDLQIDLEKLFG